MKKVFKVMISVITILTFAMLVRFAILGNNSKEGQARGLLSGTLAPCPDKPNCVCSEFTDDASHYIEPIDYSGTASKGAWNDVLNIIQAKGGEVAVANDVYISATFSVSLFGFTDDVECRLDTLQKKIHIRSASRVGYSDLGVNKKRVETIARLFKRKLNDDL